MKNFLFVVVLCIFLSSLALAAEKVELRLDKYLLVKVQKVCALRTLSSEAVLKDVLGLNQDYTLNLVRKIEGKNLTHSRYTLLYRGVPVWGEQIVITEDSNNMIARLHGTAVLKIENDIKSVKPAFDAAKALESMKKHQRDKSEEAWLYRNETSELVIYVHNDKAVLSYAVSFFADVEKGGQPTRPYYIVDANTQEVLLHFEGLTTEGGTGPGGNEKTGQYRYGAEYPTFPVQYSSGTATMDSTNVKTVDLKHGYSGSTAYSYAGLENTHEAINGAFCPLNDAHYFGGVVFGVYKDWYNSAPLTFKLTLKVHYANSYENAFWDGSSMSFGDGKSRFYPLVSLDVVSHEVSHGFTEQNSGLIYSKQSGGINEAFSDIAGEAAEYYMKNKNDFMVGADIFKSTGALRYMYDPPKDGRSIGHAKDYYDGMDVHYSSGVFNKAFYLIAVTNGWNTKKAFDIFVKANQVYWTPSATFVTGAQGVKDAANDYGYSTADVVNAFAGVGVTITD